MPLSRSDAFMPSASQATASYVIKDKSSSASNSPSGDAICAVCGDGHAKLHYGVSFFFLISTKILTQVLKPKFYLNITYF